MLRRVKKREFWSTPMLARVAALVVFTLIASVQAQTQTWPARPVTLVVPFGAGVTGDIVARGLAEYLSGSLGQPFVVENRGGAGGNLGGNVVAKAAPDGYTLLLSTTGPASLNKLTYKNMPYDPQRDLAPIVLFGKAPVIITARNSLPAHTLKEFVEYAKQNPGKITAGYPATVRRATSRVSCCSSVPEYPSRRRSIAAALGSSLIFWASRSTSAWIRSRRTWR